MYIKIRKWGGDTLIRNDSTCTCIRFLSGYAAPYTRYMHTHLRIRVDDATEYLPIGLIAIPPTTGDPFPASTYYQSINPHYPIRALNIARAIHPIIV